MIRYLAGRTAQCALVMLIMSFLVYSLIGIMPGDPIDLMLSADPRLTAEDATRLRAFHGLDRPIGERYLAWLAAAAQGELGYSRLHAQPVTAVLASHLGHTLALLGTSFVLAIAIAVPLGVAAARRPRGFIDHAVNLFCFAGISVPPFWLALLLIMAFAVGLGWLPAGGLHSPGGGGLGDMLAHLVLPVATLTLASIAGYTRFVRAAMIEALRQDFVRTARAKGAGEGRVLVCHALRAAIVPVVTIVALHFGGLVSGALVTETMFSYPGMGRMIYDAIMGNDFNLALAGLVLATLMTLLANLAADLSYAALDPRVRLTPEAK
ncbi:MAG: ABC transporter permease [Alphaproteobacteria bacterium]